MPKNESTSLAQVFCKAIDDKNLASVKNLIDCVDINHVTSNGLSALWVALSPKSGLPDLNIINFLLSYHENRQCTLDTRQQYLGWTYTEYLKAFFPRISQRIIMKLKSAESPYFQVRHVKKSRNRIRQIPASEFKHDYIDNESLFGVDVSGRDLSGENLEGFDCRLMTFSKETNWTNANLINCHFTPGVISGIFFQGCAGLLKQLIDINTIGWQQLTTPLIGFRKSENYPLSIAAFYNYADVINVILNSKHGSPGVLQLSQGMDSHSLSPLILSIRMQNKAATKAILYSKHCTEGIFNQVDDNGNNILILAIQYKDLDSLKIILKHHLCTRKLFESKNEYGSDVTDSLMSCSNKKIIKLVLNSEYCPVSNIVERMLELERFNHFHNYDIALLSCVFEHQDFYREHLYLMQSKSSGNNLLHIAMFQNNWNACEFILETLPKRFIEDLFILGNNLFQSPLYLALRYRRLFIVNKFLDYIKDSYIDDSVLYNYSPSRFYFDDSKQEVRIGSFNKVLKENVTFDDVKEPFLLRFVNNEIKKALKNDFLTDDERACLLLFHYRDLPFLKGNIDMQGVYNVLNAYMANIAWKQKNNRYLRFYKTETEIKKMDRLLKHVSCLDKKALVNVLFEQLQKDARQSHAKQPLLVKILCFCINSILSMSEDEFNIKINRSTAANSLF